VNCKQSAVRRIHRVALFVAIVVFAASSAAYSQVPKADDIAACNAEAERAVRAGTASGDSAQPNAKDQHRAAQARRTEATAQSGVTGVTSDDPQLAGMSSEGAKDPAYQAAYRTCMRKAGF
jgi:hypothetical protein